MRLPKLLDNPLTRYLGKLSYSIYLTQFLIISTLSELGFYQYLTTVTDSNNKNLALATLSTIVIIVAASSATYKLIEEPFMRLGKFSFRNQARGIETT